MCIEYRALNQKIRPDKYQLPRINDLLEWLINDKCLNSINLYIGYHQVAIRQENEYKTAF